MGFRVRQRSVAPKSTPFIQGAALLPNLVKSDVSYLRRFQQNSRMISDASECNDVFGKCSFAVGGSVAPRPTLALRL